MLYSPQIANLYFRKSGRQIADRITNHTLPKLSADRKQRVEKLSSTAATVGIQEIQPLLEAIRDGQGSATGGLSLHSNALGVQQQLAALDRFATEIVNIDARVRQLGRIVEHIDVDEEYDLDLPELEYLGW